MRTYYSRTLRIISAVTLAFFSWTFLSLWQIPAAMAAEKQNAAAKGQAVGKPIARGQKPEERFEGVLADLREKVSKAGEKNAKGKDDTVEREAIKAKRFSIDQVSEELRAEFASTEKKLKDAKLPSEILKRHADFVAHFERNAKELHDNLDGIEAAKTKKDRGAKIEKARLHLAQVTAKRKTVPLDPNNLPHRNIRAKEKAPRLTPEEFRRDFPEQISQNKKKIAGDFYFHSVIRNSQSGISYKPILLAFNETASDVPFSLGVQPLAYKSEIGDVQSQIAFSDSSPLLLAQQTADLPTPEDLAEAPPAIQFTPAIRTKAQDELGCSPTKIFSFVRNEIDFVPSYGSILGADMCLQTRQCNDLDTNSLLAALLRSCNFPTRMNIGTIELPIEKVMNWAGGFSDPIAAATFIASGGIPGKLIISGGKPSKIQMEHSWLETYIPYGNYRGAIMDDSLKTWIPMDGSFKQFTYTNGFDITGTVPFSQDEYMSQVQTQNPVHYYQSKIQEYLDANIPDTSIVDVKGYREITQETYHFLPSTLPFKTIVLGSKFSGIPDSMTAKVIFTLTDPSSGSAVSYTATTAELAGKRLTMSYLPAAATDEALIAYYGGFLYDVPAYMLNLKAVLRVEGVIKLTGEATTLGSEQSMTMQFTQPSGMNELVNKKLIAGAYYAIGTDLQGINENVLGKRNYQLNTNVLSETAGTLGNDDLIGEHLFILMTTYHLANDKIYKSGAKLYNTVVTRTLSEGITSFTLSVSNIFGIPKAARPSGINMDVAMDRIVAVAKDGDTSKEKAYVEIAGLVSSYHEHDIFEKIDGFASVSAVRALQVAAANAIPIQQINASNIAAMLPMLQVGSEIKIDIQNAVNAGKEVTISQSNAQVNDWNGVGYIIKDTVTGAGAYMISGGLAGSDSTEKKDGLQIVEINKEPFGWVKNNIDPQTRSTIALAATLEIGEEIAQAAVDLIPQYPQPNAYNNVGTCVGVVRKAYMAAGICLDEWSGCPIKESVGWKNGIRWSTGMNGVKYLYDLAGKLNLNESVSKTRAPLVGDMVFFKYTDDPNVRDHVGVVIAGPDADGTIRFADATPFYGVMDNYPAGMNLSQPNNVKFNKPLLSRSKTGCTSCYAGGLFDGFGTVRNIMAQPTNP